MITGTVKWFNNAKGYGFICPVDNNVIEGDIFAHFSSINSEGYRTLKAGQNVTFDLGEGIMTRPTKMIIKETPINQRSYPAINLFFT